MTKRFAATAILALLMSSVVHGQNTSDLLQKGLHLQEAAGMKRMWFWG